MKISQHLWIFTIGAIGFFLLGIRCSKPVPVEELVKAREAISLAAKSHVKDEKVIDYLKRSKDSLKEAHTRLPEENYEEAKNMANRSYWLARLSIQEALPILIQEVKEDADFKMEQAYDANAEVLAKEDYESSLSFRKEAQEGEKKWKEYELTKEEKDKIARQEFSSEEEKKKLSEKLETYITVGALVKDRLQKSLKSSTIAYETSLSHKEEYLNQLSASDERLESAKKYQIEKYEPERTSIAIQKINETRNQIQENQLRLAYINLQELEKETQELYAIAIQNYAKDKLEEATEHYSSVEKKVEASRNLIRRSDKKKIQETLQGANESLNEAKNQYDAGEYEESIQNSLEVLKLKDIILELIEQSSLAYKRELRNQKIRKEEKEENLARKEKEIKEFQEEDSSIKLIYTVKKTKPAECLWRIAGKKEVYNNPKKWKKIYRANQDIIKNPDLIYPGQKLKIPKE